MKTKLILVGISLAFLASHVCFSQALDSGPASKYVYCQIVGTQKFLNPNKVTIEIDFGDEKSYWKDNRLKDEATGKVKVFNSMIDALNMMGKDGWEFVQAYAITVGQQNVYHYLMRRPAD